MKRLALLRHAKSSSADSGIRDFDRPLNQRGRAAAEGMGQWMRDHGLAFDHVVASPAQRVAETLDRVAQGYGSRWDINLEPSVYEASPDMLLGLVRRLPNGAASALIAGHSPGLQLLALALTHIDQAGRRDQVAAKFPTAALVQIELPCERWSEVAMGLGELSMFASPKILGES